MSGPKSRPDQRIGGSTPAPVPLRVFDKKMQDGGYVSDAVLSDNG